MRVRMKIGLGIVPLLAALGCGGASARTCTVQVMDDDGVVMSATDTTTGDCVGTVYGDSVATDTTGQTFYRLDSVATDPTGG